MNLLHWGDMILMQWTRGLHGNGDHIHGNTAGMGSNADGNTAIKWKRDEQWLLTACCSCMDCKRCSLGLEMDQNLHFIYVSLYSLIHYAQCRHSLVWDGYSVHGDGRGWGSVSVPVQTSTINQLQARQHRLKTLKSFPLCGRGLTIRVFTHFGRSPYWPRLQCTVYRANSNILT